ncbi:hypothetical protein ACOMHN_030186 [Nucella lapillus]
MWVRNWLTEERRREMSHFYTLLDMTMQDLDQRMFRNYTRLTREIFMEVLDKICATITKQDTNMRNAIEPGLKLAVTLRCATPSRTPTTWKPSPMSGAKMAGRPLLTKFNTRWNMPHTMGALEGKHVAIKKPNKTGTLYHNYKGFFSIPILALVDADYKFLWVEVGGQGHMSDAQIFLATTLQEELEDGTINRPAPCPLTDDPEDTTPVPFFIVSDDAFALKDYCMKPYSRHTMAPWELIFNYRLSRARRVVENAFELLAQHFRVLLRTFELKPENVREVIKCCIILHNVLLQRFPPPQDAVDREDAQKDLLPGAWREHLIWEDQPQPQAARANTAGKPVRETLADYFGSPAGIVPWQWEKANVRQPARAANPDPAAAAPPGPHGPAAQSPPSSPE